MTVNSIFRSLAAVGPHLSRALALLLLAGPAWAEGEQASGAGSILNILLLALVAYFLVRMFRRRSGGDRPDDRPGDRPGPRPGDGANGDGPDSGDSGDAGDVRRPPARPVDRYEAARQMWTMLGGDGEEGGERGGDAPSRAIPPAAVEAGFDEREFLEGAKLFYTRLRQTDGVEDLDELKPFLSGDVYDHARAAIESGAYRREEVMLLDARVADMRTEGGRTMISVSYDATLGGEGNQTHQRRSVWAFSRDDGVENGLWTLDAIDNMN
ncbi:TIM44-like domain-containing protein [Pseudodesulfovibrio sp.]|uniref:TIM44-like domain-containing protein n=1 Tax=Pseudodesulfovibrio sp. TaxID=2035812 RepID=UPI0026016C35|nr:TIM44-like domain-containing protein [Pseudodesulfovibrio sp.]MDD3310651.1 TIM44-like domain-containing protein [Pseudodesulfovibrio sp.]